MEKWRNIEKRKREYLSIMSNIKTIVVFDVETTGLKESAKIIQFSASRYSVKELDLIYDSKINIYINPEEKLPEKITQITGITDDMLKDKLPEIRVVDEILTFIYSADAIVGYNIMFDIEMLKRMCSRTGRIYKEITNMDVLEMARDFCDQNILSEYTLSSISDYIFPEDDYEYHDSNEDIRATANLFAYFINKYNEHEEEDRHMPVHLEKASLFINPRQKSQQRIRMHIAGDYEVGAIYYDIVKKIWSCKSNTASKRLFRNCDMQSLEDQFMQMYGYRFNLNTIDEVAKSWMKYRREIKKSG